MSNPRTDNAIMSSLRRCWSRSARRREILDKARHPNKVGPRGGARHVCRECGEALGQGDMNVDHIDPVVPVDKRRSDMTWDEVIFRMFYCPDSNLQALCKKCHDIKSRSENTERKTHRAILKEKDKK